LFGLYGLGPFHLASELAEKLLYPFGHLLGVYLANIIGILNWVLAEGHLQVEAIVAKKCGAISRLQGMIIGCTFFQW
jgi:hypothetical protein